MATKEGMVEIIKKELGDNYRNDIDTLNNLFDDYMQIATNTSGRKELDDKINPYVKTAVKSAYLRLGNEGSSSASEGSLSSSYVDIEDKLKKDASSVRILK